MTSFVAIDSAAASLGGLRSSTTLGIDWGAVLAPRANRPPPKPPAPPVCCCCASRSATRWPRPVPVASRMWMLATRPLLMVRLAMYVGRTVTAPKNTGPKMVVKMNHRDRTRSRYSRLMTTQSLSIARHPHFDARRADFLEENLVHRRLHEFESLDFRARVAEAAEE